MTQTIALVLTAVVSIATALGIAWAVLGLGQWAMGDYDRSVIERFRARVGHFERSGCHVWLMGCTAQGYGRFDFHHEGVLEQWLTHRFAWTLANGPIPEGLWVLHHCDNPPCCRLDHLFLGTQKENMIDCAKKGRIHIPTEEETQQARVLRTQNMLTRTHCRNGHELTEENTYHPPARHGGIERACRTCRLEAKRRYNARLKS